MIKFDTFSIIYEKAVSVQQQKLMALAYKYKKGELEDDKVSDVVKKLAGEMSEKDLEDFAKTKHKGLPDKVEEGTLQELRTTLVTGDSEGLDFILKDLKKKMYNDIRHNKLKFVNGIAKFVNIKIDKDKQQKGRMAISPLGK
jgi:hypothetical protein